MSVLDVDFFIRFAITLFFIAFLSYGCYYRVEKNFDFAGACMLFGAAIFIVVYFLHRADMSMGFAFGLFAVFTMLRYRTESISIKEMTYLFLVIAIALLTAVAQIGILQLMIINAILCAVAYIIESGLLGQQYPKQSIVYGKIENLKPKNIFILITDLSNCTGLDIVSIKIKSIDLVKNSSVLRVSYRPGPPEKPQLRSEIDNIDYIEKNEH